MVNQSSLQGQIQVLSDKIDQLHGIVLTLSRQMSSGIDPNSLSPNDQPTPSSASLGTDLSGNNDLYHKDILPDKPESSSFWLKDVAQPATTELQIHRLTAQLTAAYHRIAALEERLMAQRSHV